MPAKGTINSPPVECICQTCGKPFSIVAARKSAKYCSSACYNATRHAGKIERVCPRCGKTFLCTPSRVAKAKNVHCSNKCAGMTYKEQHLGRYNGGRTTSRGYVLIKMPEHHAANPNGYVPEHRYVMEEHLGRPLRRDEQVHHRDGNKANNAIENLQIVTPSEHTLLHHPPLNRWSLNYDQCIVCGKHDRPHDGRGHCERCYERLFRAPRNRSDHSAR